MAIKKCYYLNGVGVYYFLSVSSDNFLLLSYTFLPLVWTTDFCYSYLIFFVFFLLKKDKKDEIGSSLKKGEGGPTFKL